MSYKEELVKPVLFMVFNRPEKTQQVFNAIKIAKPKKFYVAADAPRESVPDDIEKCRKVRAIVSNIDWDCDAKFLFHEKNLGCSLAGVNAWDWLFSMETEMIFLEDDGIPSRSFFWFCQELLDKYKDNPKISHICGQNFGKTYGNATYFFTRYAGATWGFATWKRTHELFDFKLNTYESFKNDKLVKKKFYTHFEYMYITKLFDRYVKHGGNTYDLQHSYLMYKYNLFDIMPNINLVTNIGYDMEAANNKVSENSRSARKYGNLPRYELNEIVHPDEIKIDVSFEKQQMLHRIFQDKPRYRIFIDVYLPYLKNVFRPIIKFLHK